MKFAGPEYRGHSHGFHRISFLEANIQGFAAGSTQLTKCNTRGNSREPESNFHRITVWR
jgi:hypothetical protein